MARTHSSYTASPTRWRSPQRSPQRPTSENGSEYEMVLDAFGPNSTFESTELDERHQPKVDVVETSDIEGPEDFTMNMTYWMTADLPLAQQIRSRKEANVNIAELRGDARLETEVVQDTTAEGDKAVIEESSPDRDVHAELNSASPTMRANAMGNERSSSKAPSEGSMENEEKVRSYLSALPDTDIGENALTSTPLRIPKQNMLQVPSPAAPRARSLQPTVEDYDTPRKPTQETVIHHPQERTLEKERDELRKQIAELQARLEQQELASKTRNTELETLLSYTRSDLESSRTESYKQKEQINALQRDNQRQKDALEASRASVAAQLKAQEEELSAKMQEFGEELRLQNLAKLQNQREEFERQLRALEEAKRIVDKDMAARGQLLEQVRNELSQLRQSHEQDLKDMKNANSSEHSRSQDAPKEHMDLHARLSTVQSRADALRVELQNATMAAKAAREEAEANVALHASAQTANGAQKTRISHLESHLESAESQLDSARADLAAKDFQLQRRVNVDSRLQELQSQLDAAKNEATAKDRQLSLNSDLDMRIRSLQSQLDSARADATAKDQQMMRHIEEQERYEQRLNTAQGRLEGLEATVSTLRQQLAEAHRDSAKARTDAEQFESLLEDANDRLQDARAEADRRVADVDKKLSKVKELKAEVDSSLKELRSQHDELIETHEAKLEDVREKAEDAVRKAGSLLEQERKEKKRITRELKKTSHELEHLRAEAAQKTAAEELSSEESSLLSSTHTDAKDTQLENLRTLLRKQASTLKTLKSETTSLRKENTRLKANEATSDTIADLQAKLDALQHENESLKTDAAERQDDFEAINQAMDERLATMMSKVLKERARNVVGKRDGQWAESVGKASSEREFMGRVLMREWGRQEVGIAPEGENQGYRYKYVKRS